MLGHNEPKASDEFLFPFDRNPRCFSASGAQKTFWQNLSHFTDLMELPDKNPVRSLTLQCVSVRIQRFD
jgi:hypothetical protein